MSFFVDQGSVLVVDLIGFTNRPLPIWPKRPSWGEKNNWCVHLELSLISNIWKLEVFSSSKDDLLPPWLGRFAILSAVFQSGKPRTTFWCLAHEICQSIINNQRLILSYRPTRSVNFAIRSSVNLNPQVKHKLPWTMLGLTPSCICSRWESLHLSLSEIHISIRSNNITRSSYHKYPLLTCCSVAMHRMSPNRGW